MKKGWKAFWIVCVVIALVGFGMCVAGFALGFNLKEATNVFQDDYYIKKNVMITEKASVTSDDSNEENEGLSLSEDAKNLKDLPSYEFVNNLTVDMDAAQLTIKTYNGDNVRIDFGGLGNRIKYSVNQDGGELDVDVSVKKNHIFSEGNVGSMIIYVPKDLELKDFSLDVGAGEVKIGDIRAKEISIDCGAGSVTYSTSQAEEDFNYDISCGIGEVKLGDSKFSGIGSEKKIDHDASQELNIDCGVGEIIINYI